MQCNVDADDDILDMLQETDNLKEAPAVREEKLEERLEEAVRIKLPKLKQTSSNRH